MQFKCGDMYYSSGGGTTDPAVYVAWDEASSADINPSNATDFDT